MVWPLGYRIFVLPAVRLIDPALVRPPAGWPARPYPSAILQFLDGAPWRRSRREAERELTKRIEQASRALRWPSALLVEPPDSRYETVIEDPLAWCVAASKTTGKILLLNRRPNLERLRGAQPMVLCFPAAR